MKKELPHKGDLYLSQQVGNLVNTTAQRKNMVDGGSACQAAYHRHIVVFKVRAVTLTAL